jgi:hypothetical protein
MGYYSGLDVSLKETFISIVNKDKVMLLNTKANVSDISAVFNYK